MEAGSLLKGVRDKTILNSSDLDIATKSKNIENILEALKELSVFGYDYNFNGGYPLLEDMVTIYLPQKINKISHLDIYIYNDSKNFILDVHITNLYQIQNRVIYFIYQKKFLIQKNMILHQLIITKINILIHLSLNYWKVFIFSFMRKLVSHSGTLYL